MSQSKWSKGSSAAIALIIILVAAIISFGGWYVWQNNKTEPTPKTNQTTKKTTKTTDPSEGGKYLVIKEWGVRFKLPQDLQGGVTYGISVASSGDKETAWFEVDKIAKLPGSNCRLSDAKTVGNSGKEGGIGVYLARTPEKVPDNQTSFYYGPATNIHIGNYWYSGGRDKYADTCVNNENYTQLTIDTSGSLTYSLEGLEQFQNN
ncbi:MAG TPA: hypothetical protein VLG37_00030 [Candidatus Saccharimonadales bacterium]|nr:hypothetical protein [Candidatus Saccharimonadales bacterium]